MAIELFEAAGRGFFRREPIGFRIIRGELFSSWPRLQPDQAAPPAFHDLELPVRRPVEPVGGLKQSPEIRLAARGAFHADCWLSSLSVIRCRRNTALSSRAVSFLCGWNSRRFLHIRGNSLSASRSPRTRAAAILSFPEIP